MFVRREVARWLDRWEVALRLVGWRGGPVFFRREVICVLSFGALRFPLTPPVVEIKYLSFSQNLEKCMNNQFVCCS